MIGDPAFVVSTALAADPETVWARVSTPEGINYELGPWLRMTVPTTASGIAFVPRAPGAGRAQRALLHAIFRRRHRRLVRHFGEVP